MRPTAVHTAEHADCVLTYLECRDGPSQLLSQPDAAIWELDTAFGVIDALMMLERELPGAAGVKPGVNCGGTFAAPGIPSLPQGG